MISSEVIETVDSWLGSVVCVFFPGLLILDSVFHKGLFSSTPGNIYEFVLFVIYAVAISLPYTFIAQAEMKKIYLQASSQH